MISMKCNTIISYCAKFAMREKKDETKSCFIRHKKDWILIRSDPKYLETF